VLWNLNCAVQFVRELRDDPGSWKVTHWLRLFARKQTRRISERLADDDLRVWECVGNDPGGFMSYVANPTTDLQKHFLFASLKTAPTPRTFLEARLSGPDRGELLLLPLSRRFEFSSAHQDRVLTVTGRDHRVDAKVDTDCLYRLDRFCVRKFAHNRKSAE
jgi:hypothetical protein